MKLLSIPLFLFAVLAVVGCGDGDTTSPSSPLLFSAIPDQDETRLREKFEPIARYLEQKLGVPVRYVHATSYPDAVELFKNGDIHLAWFGGLSGVQARHQVPGARAIAQGEADPEFFSYFIAHRDSGIQPGEAFPTDLAGKTFTFGSNSSTSGRLMPEFFIRKFAKSSPNDLFSRIGFSGSHDKTAELVESGSFDVGALNYKVYERRVQSGQTDPNICRVIWKTPVYPDYNFTAHPELEKRFGEGFIDRLQKALLSMDDPALLSAFPRNRMIPASNEDYDPIHQLAEDLQFIQ
ncbi:MAG: putative selenate ABC transporter substrate-binding protein [Planctomycetota bacterium]|jgi:phosphonate transport system substrate-binding protein|nr:putative selenate ABC transporter substrate-binding protein [Planctomycetota bacterium]